MLVNGQDYHLSQFFEAPVFANPSMTGLFDGKYRFHFHTRRQWNSLMSKPYQTNLLTFDMPLTTKQNSNRLSTGLMIMNNRAGAGNFNVLNVLASGAYYYKLPGSDKHNISIGAQIGFMNKSLNTDNLIFNSQYDPTSGGNFDSQIESGEIYMKKSLFMADLNAGAIYFFSGNSQFHPFLGISVFHIVPPKESFYDEKNTLPRRYTYNLGTKYFLSEKAIITFQSLIMHQVNASEFLFDLSMSYKMNGYKQYLLFGTSYRAKDASVVHLGYKYDRYSGRLSYDINASKLREYSSYKGGFEFSFTYELTKRPSIPIIESCPAL